MCGAELNKHEDAALPRKELMWKPHGILSLLYVFPGGLILRLSLIQHPSGKASPHPFVWYKDGEMLSLHTRKQMLSLSDKGSRIFLCG